MPCKMCGECCRHLDFVVDSSENTKEFYARRGVLHVAEHGGSMIVSVRQTCDYLDDQKNKCLLHDGNKKPLWCKVYPTAPDEELIAAGIDPDKLLVKGCGFKYDAETKKYV
jgi:hypothetical protein